MACNTTGGSVVAPATSAPVAPTAPGSGSAPATSAPAAAAPTAAPTTAPETVYVFNTGSRDVTLIDAATRTVKDTKPLNAQVRWLSNEQTYWDGQLVWTYDFP